MVLVGEVQELRLHPGALQVVPEPQALGDRHAVVLVAVDDQHRRGDRPHVAVGRVGVVALALVERVAPLATPVERGVGGADEAVEVPDAGVGDDRGEPVGVPGHPVGHVAAEGPAHRGDARGVDVLARHRGLGGRHEVGVGQLAPGPGGGVEELLAVAGGQARVGQQHRPAARGHQPRVPAPRPGVPARQRPAVDPEDQRGRGRRRRASGQHQPRAQCRAVGGGGVHLGERPGQRVELRHPAQRRGLLVGGLGVETHRRRWRVDARAQRVERRAVPGGDDVGVGPGAGQAGDGAVGDRHAQHRPVPGLVDDDVHDVAARGPGDAPDLDGFLGEDVALAPVLQGARLQRVRHPAPRAGVPLAHPQQPPAVRGDGGRLVVGPRLVADDDAPVLGVQLEAAAPRRGVDGVGYLRDHRDGPPVGADRAAAEAVVGAGGDVLGLAVAGVGVGRVRGRAPLQVGAAGAEVVVPEADRELGVQPRRDARGLARLPLLGGVALHRLRGDQRERAGVAGDGEAADAAGTLGHRPGLAAPGGQQPQGGPVLGRLLRRGVGAPGGEEQVAVRGERRRRLAGRRPRQAPRRPLTARVELPQRRAVLLPVRGELRDGGDEARAVRGQREPGTAAGGDEGVEVVERAHALIRSRNPDPRHCRARSPVIDGAIRTLNVCDGTPLTPSRRGPSPP